MIYLTREGDNVNNNRTITWLIDCDTRHCTNVQCCRVAWYFLLFVLLPQLPVVLCLHIEYGEAGGGVRLLPVLADGGDVLLPVVAGGGLVPLSAVVAGGGLVLPSAVAWWWTRPAAIISW